MGFCAFSKKMARMNRPAPVEITYKNMRFLITHNPTNATLNKFIEELKKYSVTTVVRVCEATYDTSPVEKEGIQFLDWPFDDGAPPSNQIVDDWLTLLRAKFREEPGCCIAVHCVAGLGRYVLFLRLLLHVFNTMVVNQAGQHKCAKLTSVIV
ncbi:protein tyrosine phosphatase type IVA 1 isoform X1 [Rhincodon typus]|uniref:protein tyrosine phosphatase type IVA 1 isoform X1 n=2 Tax=Rhincodon typus TaxID=259920 RepID=UPI00202E9967|nr:protein tyrosine phosphatase type IVA 1 isoform X1 [Rhincodon typus]